MAHLVSLPCAGSSHAQRTHSAGAALAADGRRAQSAVAGCGPGCRQSAGRPHPQRYAGRLWHQDGAGTQLPGDCGWRHASSPGEHFLQQDFQNFLSPIANAMAAQGVTQHLCMPDLLTSCLSGCLRLLASSQCTLVGARPAQLGEEVLQRARCSRSCNVAGDLCQFSPPDGLDLLDDGSRGCADPWNVVVVIQWLAPRLP